VRPGGREKRGEEGKLSAVELGAEQSHGDLAVGGVGGAVKGVVRDGLAERGDGAGGGRVGGAPPNKNECGDGCRATHDASEVIWVAESCLPAISLRAAVASGTRHLPIRERSHRGRLHDSL